MDEAKIGLSKVERELVADAGWILTKNSILEKVKELLGEIQVMYRKQLEQFSGLPAGIAESSPKISRGENYRGLPWLVLDYPRCFGQQDIFAIRTMFWWGHFFSLTLHLSGKYKKAYGPAIISSFDSLAVNRYFICVNEDAWQHHFEKSNYMPVDETGYTDFQAVVTKKTFIKLAVKTPLEQWNDSPRILEEHFIRLLAMLAD